jgi:hypothetical protein
VAGHRSRVARFTKSFVGVQVRMKPKNHAAVPAPAARPEDEKMNKIVEEVDRFFKSVHADVEDWKFSMEDYGDGTRLFVRFQIHFDQSVVSRSSRSSKGSPPPAAEVPERLELRPTSDGKLESKERTDRAVLEEEPSDTAAGHRAELDLASFVSQWRRKREHNIHGEFHKEGAPYVDAKPDRPVPPPLTEHRLPARSGTPGPVAPRVGHARR